MTPPRSPRSAEPPAPIPAPAADAAVSPAGKPLRWGILGAAQIARKNWKAIRLSGNGVVAAVASRDAVRARAFVEACQRDVPMGCDVSIHANYASLLASGDIDAVYLPLPTGVRREWVIRAAEHGKHVVCEKPCAPSLADLTAMLEACDRHRVQFMDGVMFTHSARLEALGRLLHERRALGRLRRVVSAFSFLAPEDFAAENIRGQAELEPQGCLGDLGWYCIRLSLWAMRGRTPRAVSGRCLASMRGARSAGPVPAEFSGEMVFDDETSAAFHCSFRICDQQWAQIGGTDGELRIEDFVLPFYGSETRFEIKAPFFAVDGCSFHMEERSRQFSVAEYSDGHASSQEARMFRAFARQVRSGQLSAAWPGMAFATQAVMEAMLESAARGGVLVGLNEPGRV